MTKSVRGGEFFVLPLFFFCLDDINMHFVFDGFISFELFINILFRSQ